MILILIFAEALALYGLIGALYSCSFVRELYLLLHCRSGAACIASSTADKGLCRAQWASSSRPRPDSRSRLCASIDSNVSIWRVPCGRRSLAVCTWHRCAAQLFFLQGQEAPQVCRNGSGKLLCRADLVTAIAC